MPSPVLQVQVSRAELEALDRRATALGVSAPDLVRRLIASGLAAEGAPVTPSDPLTFEPPPQAEPWGGGRAAWRPSIPRRWALPFDGSE